MAQRTEGLMGDAAGSQHLLARLRLHSWGGALIWTACVAASLLWNVHVHRENTREIARSVAEVTFASDVAHRQWAAAQGGVYVPVSEITPPNPYLQVPDRDVMTTGGVALTLVNPAYMARLVNQMEAEAPGNRAHITSLRPIRPENRPDAWEAAGLQAFESGVREVSAIEKTADGERLRMMRPFLTEKACLKCHAAQGYKEGDIRGGISVSVPLASLREIEGTHLASMSLAHGLLWLLGLAGVVVSTGGLRREVLARLRSEEALRQSQRELLQANERLEERVRERTMQLRALAGELTLAGQRERRRLAGVLHDHLQQLLVAVKLRLALLGRSSDEGVRKATAEADQILGEAITASRTLTGELNPPIMQDDGLETALRWLAHWMVDKHSLAVDLDLEQEIPPLAEDVRVLLFESVRELLFNAAKHSQVQAARVSVRRSGDGLLRVTVSDEGSGFDLGRLKPAGEPGGGFGLFSIRERLNLIGGRFEVHSTPGQGSRFVLTVPLGGGPATRQAK